MAQSPSYIAFYITASAERAIFYPEALFHAFQGTSYRVMLKIRGEYMASLPYKGLYGKVQGIGGIVGKYDLLGCINR